MLHVYKHVLSLLFNRINLQSTIQKYLTIIILNGRIFIFINNIIDSNPRNDFGVTVFTSAFYSWVGTRSFGLDF